MGLCETNSCIEVIVEEAMESNIETGKKPNVARVTKEKL